MKGNFFGKRLLRYFVCMLIPTVLVFAVSFFMFLQSTDKTLAEQGRKTVNSVDANFDLVINEVLHQNDMLSNTSRMSIALKKVLSGNDLTYWDSIYLGSMRVTLNSVVAAQNYIDSIYYYLDDSTYFLSSADGIQNTGLSTDISWLNLYRAMPSDVRSMIVKRQQNADIDIMQTISVIQRILLQKGCIVVNVNIPKFRRMLQSMLSNRYERVIVFDRYGTILLSDSDDDGVTAGLQKEFASLFSGGKRNAGDVLAAADGTWLHFGTGTYLFSVEHFQNEDFHIVSLISSRARNPFIFSALKTYLMILLVNSIMIFVFSYFITRRTFSQIQYINKIFENAEQGIFTDYEEAPVKDEYGLIMNRIIHLFVNTTYLHAQLKEKEYSQEVAELQALQLQINPHFLFNTLQALDLEVRRREPDGSEEISTIISDVSDILKYSLSDPQEPVTLVTEILYLKKYVQVQKFRFGDRFIIYYEIDDGVEDAAVFKLLLQPLVENALRYGIQNIEDKAYIRVIVQKQDTMLKFCIEDNGPGMSAQKVAELKKQFGGSPSEHIGLKNVNKRLTLKYGKDAELHIDSQPGSGTQISFTIPYTVYEQYTVRGSKGVKNYENHNI